MLKESWRHIKAWVDFAATIAVLVAASVIVWNNVKRSSPRTPNQPSVQAAAGRIEATKIRHSEGEGDVALVEFTDFQCPFCGKYERETAPQLRKAFVETGRVKYVFFNFPLETIHANAFKASEAAECAGRQGRFWQMRDQLFEHQGGLSEPELRAYAATVGLDGGAFEVCLQAQAADTVRSDMAEGKRLNVTGTPAFFLGHVGKDGSIDLTARLNGAVPFATFQQELEKLEGKSKATAGEKHAAVTGDSLQTRN